MLVEIGFVGQRGVGDIIAIGQALITAHTFEVIYPDRKVTPLY